LLASVYTVDQQLGRECPHAIELKHKRQPAGSRIVRDPEIYLDDSRNDAWRVAGKRDFKRAVKAYSQTG
jgi:hypothetical protein